MMKPLVQKLKSFATSAAQNKVARLVGLTNVLAFVSTRALAQTAGFQLPMGDVFCSVASAMQSQWAPGIILIVIIVEAFLFLVVKNGVMQMLMVVLLAATLALGAGKFLHLISPNAGCAAVM
jgi:hypothetical protein